MIEPNQLVGRSSVSHREDQIFEQQRFQLCRDTDRMFVLLMLAQWLGAILVALVVSPRTWIGSTSSVHLHVWTAVFLGGAISSLPVFLGLKYPGHPLTRHVIATAQLLWSALLIHLTGGRIETHFHIFGSLALLAFYRDWRVLITATVVTTLNHVIGGIWWPQSLYGVFVESPYRFIEHAGWVLCEVFFLAKMCCRSTTEHHAIARRQAQLEATNETIEEEVRQRTSALVHSQQRVKASRMRLTSMLASSLDPTLTINTRGIVQTASDSVEKVFGWKPAELIGKNINVLMPEPYRSAHDGYLAKFLHTGISDGLGYSREFSAERRDGTVFPCEVTIWKVDLPAPSEPLIMGTIRDCTERKRTEAELESLNRQLINAARQAGKAEIATNVLHNVGNVLNSVNVSAGLVREKLRQSPVSDLTRAVNLMQQHHDDLGPYLTQDERGKHLPRFLIELSRQMTSEEEIILDEVNSLVSNIDHINAIIAMQQSYANGISSMVEEISLAELLEDAIRINTASMKRHLVEVVRQFDDVEPVAVDKQKLLMILVNLISNAKYACMESGKDTHQITVSLRCTSEDRIAIEVRDNGMGILGENLTRIFAHGFTTRKEGHGFGLHSAAIAAEELEGSLAAFSDGPGSGATFQLEIPYRRGRIPQCAT